MTDFNYF